MANLGPEVEKNDQIILENITSTQVISISCLNKMVFALLTRIQIVLHNFWRKKCMKSSNFEALNISMLGSE